MMTNVNYHFATYTNTESLYYMPETNNTVICQLHLDLKKRKIYKPQLY